jgi:hypothetical protein
VLSLFSRSLELKLNGARLIWSYLATLNNLKHAVDIIVISSSLSAKCGSWRPINCPRVGHFNINRENLSWSAFFDGEL